ncbi:hypothetical protein GGG16DRAFT_113086 [Schizophyllum commune]
MSSANPSGTDIRPRSQPDAQSQAPYPDGPPSYDDAAAAGEQPSAVDQAVNGFAAMRLSDPAPRGLAPTDPVPRTTSAMSMRSNTFQAHPAQRMHPSPRSFTLPPGAPPPPAWAQGGPPNDGASIHSRDSRGDPAGGGYEGYDPDITSAYMDDAQSVISMDRGYPPPGPGRGYPPPQQQWGPPPPQGGYDPYYAAASNVLGMGPPGGGPPPPPPGPMYQPPPNGANYAPPPNGGGYPPNNYPPGAYAPSVASSHSSYNVSSPVSQQSPDPNSSYAGSSAQSSIYPQDTPEFEGRPPLNRGESVMPASRMTKAVDLTAPPYTKEYIDQYRQRIKADPDPEAHFQYAKYLIDAARKIRQTAKDQRAAKKYSEVLITEALKVIRRLATQGDAYAEAQFFMANCHGTGALGLQVDHERAYHLYLQAAKQNHPAACYRVAVCNEIGAGTRREPPRAAAFYRKAASLGDTAAMYKLGMILLHGMLGEQRNPREAIAWLKRAAEQADEENPHALHELGLLYEQPNSGLVPYDPAYAKALFTQAAHLGYTQSQYKLGQCYEYGHLTCPVDPKRSIAWYTKAAEKGDAEAELALSGWYLTGSEGVLKQSDSEAYLWARRAANKGLSKAEYAVGYYAEVGIGVKQDIELAKRWYMRAAAQGNKRAMNRLTELKRMGNKRSQMARPTRQQAKDECVIC